MDSHHHDIIRLAWCRHLGLEDSAFRPGRMQTHLYEQTPRTDGPPVASPVRVTYVRLGDSSVLVGPASVLERDAVKEHDALEHGALEQRGGLEQLLGVTGSTPPTVLAFAADIGTTIDRHDPLISHELAHVLELEAACTPAEVAVADLTRKRSWFTVLGDDRPADTASPLSGAAYLEWGGVLADVGVLTAPGVRRRGHAQVVARLATNDAFDEGMVPQWRAAADNDTARRLAARLGYEEWGASVTVELHPPAPPENSVG